jgi:uncharacterized protein (TIGR02099 family)
MQRLAGFCAALLRWSLGACALGLVLAALYVSLGRQLVPLVAEYRLPIEAQARAALDMPLQIGRLEGRWQGFTPVLIGHAVQLGEGANALHLKQVQLRPDLLASLLARQPRIAGLELHGLQLGVRQDAEGGWQVDGLLPRSEPASLDMTTLLRQLQTVERLSLRDSQLTVQPFEQPARSLTDINLTLRNGPGHQRLDARLSLPDGQPLALQLRTRLQPEHWRDAQAQLYLSLPQSDWATWLPPGLSRDWHLAQLQAGGEVWLSWSDGSVQRAVARLHAPQITAGYAERAPVTLQDLALNAYFERRAEGFALQVKSLAFTLGQTRWGDVQLSLSQQADSPEAQERWQLSADRLDLGPLVPLVEALVPLPDTAGAILTGLQPQGRLRNVQLDYRPQVPGAERLQFAANLQQVGFSAYHGAPAAQNISGSLSGDLAQGELRLASDNFVLHLDPLFAQPWQYRRADAQLLWRFDEQAFTLRSPYLQVEGEEGQLAGDFLIRLMRDPAAEDYMDLRVGLREGDARYTEKYLPQVLSKELAGWLKTAIRSGTVDAGYFQYQGSLNKAADETARSLSLFFAVKDAELAFQPGWPVLRKARGEVLIEDSGVRVRLTDGRLLDSQVQVATATIKHVEPGQVPHLLLDAQVQSSLGDGLKILQEAPLGTADMFAGWQGEGALEGALQLDIPLGKSSTQAQVQVDFASQGARLQLANPSLELSQLTGAFHYDSARGLSAPAISARLFGHEVRAKAFAEGSAGQPRTRIEAQGRVALPDLTGWLGVSQPLPLAGSLPYDLNLTLEGADSQLQVASNLQGLAIDLPAPFGKAAAERRASQWRMTLQGAQRRYWLDYADLASFALAAPAGALSEGRGELLLGPGRASLPGAAGLRLRGRLETLDLSAWQAVLKPYAVDPAADAKQLLRSAELQIGRFSGAGLDVENLDVQLARSEAAWALDLDSALLKGRIAFPDGDAAPIDVRLQHLRLPAAAKTVPGTASGAAPQTARQDSPDPLAALDPRQIPALNIRIEQLLLGEQVLGTWSLKARPNAQGVAFSELNLGLKGVQITGNAGWEGAPGASRSWYKGRLQGENLADVLRAWDFVPNVSSEEFRLDVDGRWPGSPAWVSPKRFSGSLEARLRKGQFSEVQGSATALRMFGLLNFNSIGRRLRLDFSDLLGKGLSYDQVKGVLTGADGVFVTREPITLTGPSSNLELSGTLDVPQDRVDAKLLVTLPLSNNLPLAALIVGAPAIGGALFVVDKLLGDRIARFASVQYSVKGSLQNPQISFDKPFDKPFSNPFDRAE